MSPCPRCQSQKTGIIKACDGFGDNIRINNLKKSLMSGLYEYQVTPDKYRTYYLPQKINAYCFDCGYEYRGEIIVTKVNKDDYEKTLDERGINALLSFKKKKTKNSLKNGIQLFKRK